MKWPSSRFLLRGWFLVLSVSPLLVTSCGFLNLSSRDEPSDEELVIMALSIKVTSVLPTYQGSCLATLSSRSDMTGDDREVCMDFHGPPGLEPSDMCYVFSTDPCRPESEYLTSEEEVCVIAIGSERNTVIKFFWEYPFPGGDYMRTYCAAMPELLHRENYTTDFVETRYCSDDPGIYFDVEACRIP